MEPEATDNGSYAVSDSHPCYKSDNTTYSFTSNPSILCVSLYVFLGILSAVTICGNLLVIISVSYFKQLHVPTNFLILSLAVADLLVGVVVFPFSMVFTVTSCWHHEGFSCKVRGGFDVTLSTASILHLCCISIDRYYAVCQPLSYKSKVNDRVTGMMILMSWAVAVLIGICIIVASFNQGKCKESCLIDALISTTLACIFSFYIPIIIILGTYLKIFLVAKRQVISIQNTTGLTKKSGTNVSKRERKATKTLAIVLGVFLLCWAPYFLSVPFLPFSNNSVPVPVIETLNWLTLSNSMLNPFIYAFFYSWFRSAFKMIICGKVFWGNFANSKLL